MLKLWYVDDGDVEEYRGQEADWERSFIVCAKSPEKAANNLANYRLGHLDSVDIIYKNKTITVIP